MKRLKEEAWTTFILEKFPEYPWRFNLTIKNTPKAYRPDAVLDCGKFILHLEFDELQHRDSRYKNNDSKRQKEILESFQKPTILIRFNPDSYVNFHKFYVRPCWGKDSSGKPCVKPEKLDQWNSRLKLFEDTVRFYLKKDVVDESEEIYLFYDGFSIKNYRKLLDSKFSSEETL